MPVSAVADPTSRVTRTNCGRDAVVRRSVRKGAGPLSRRASATLAKYGSWLNMAEPEFSVLPSQCLDRRISGKRTLADKVAACVADRNQNHAKADWQFTAGDPRVKLKRLHPAL